MTTKQSGAREVGGRSSRGELSRGRLLDAAAAELAETGGLEVAAVARRAGVSVGLPYRYFGSRSGLIRALVDDFWARLCEAVVFRQFAGASWQERERARVAEWVAFLYDDPIAPLLLGGMGGDPEVTALEAERLASTIEVGARNMARGQRDGDLPAGRDPLLLAAAVLGGVHATVAVALGRVPRPAQQRVAAELWAFVAGAVGIRAEESEAIEHRGRRR